MREKQRKLNVNTARPTDDRKRPEEKEERERVWPAHEAQAEERRGGGRPRGVRTATSLLWWSGRAGGELVPVVRVRQCNVMWDETAAARDSGNIGQIPKFPEPTDRRTNERQM